MVCFCCMFCNVKNNKHIQIITISDGDGYIYNCLYKGKDPFCLVIKEQLANARIDTVGNYYNEQVMSFILYTCKGTASLVSSCSHFVICCFYSFHSFSAALPMDIVPLACALALVSFWAWWTNNTLPRWLNHIHSSCYCFYISTYHIFFHFSIHYYCCVAASILLIIIYVCLFVYLGIILVVVVVVVVYFILKASAAKEKIPKTKIIINVF